METDSVGHVAAPLRHERSSMVDCSQNLEVGLSRAATLPATLPNDKTPDCWQLQPNTCVLTSYCPPNGTPRLRSGNGRILKDAATEHLTSPRRVPIFDGHNDVLLRLYRRGGTDAPGVPRRGGQGRDRSPTHDYEPTVELATDAA